MRLPVSQLILLITVLFASLALAQPKGMIVDMGYRWPRKWQDWKLSPGHITTLYVHGLGERLKGRIVSTLPLPLEVEGISVTVSDHLGISHHAPILAMQPLTACSLEAVADLIPCPKSMAAITIQVPYEQELRFQTLGVTTFVTILDKGTPVGYTFYSLVDRVFYIITGRDAISVTFPELDIGSPLPLVRHENGTLVSPSNPAKAGEILTLLAAGLAYDFTKPDQRPKTGEPAGEGVSIPIGDPRKLGIGIEFRFGRNPPAEMAQWEIPGLPTAGLLRAQLLPGTIGLYEITVQVPTEIPRDTPACGIHQLPPDAPVAIDYNLRVVVGYRDYSPIYDSAAICVAVQ